ncbi:type III pantothenate kinase [Motiliproteus sp. SC1-56]|uniref:type III pantothenate kinase n=1 Tax=Motiliproteus sp. SC1-56 TaxID=2799565 RepID=UPI001A8DFD57|nr:type III pantothenate kinase [Motiliproteus sp. SC1-56]
MILDLDLGNTFLKWRCGDQRGRCVSAELTGEALAQAWQTLTPARVRLASVAGESAEQLIEAVVHERWGVSLEKARTEAAAAGVVNSYEVPGRMGVDRWLAMLAGYERARGGCCVVDCGSAITVDLVDENGSHLGGYIMPGLRLMRESLLSRTQRVRPEGEPLAERVSPGRSTEECVDHGIYLMLAGLAERVATDCDRLLGAEAALFITGGDGETFYRLAGVGSLVPDLVLEGLERALP